MSPRTDIPDVADVVVVGAGLGGLICAVELARQGLKVYAFDKEPVAGGYAHNFRKKGYHFDLSLHHIGGFSPGCLTHGVLASIGVLDKLSLVRPKTLFTAEFPGFNLSLPNNPAALIKMLCERYPHQKSGIEALFEFLPRLKGDVIAPVMVPGFNVPGHDRPSYSFVERTYEQLLRDYVDDPELLAVLGQMWFYIGLPPSQSAANFSACVNSSAFVEGEWTIVGGGAALVRDVVERLRELGGDVYCGQSVSRVEVVDGRAQGIVLAGGHQVAADTVVLGCDPLYAFSELIDEKAVSAIFHYRLTQAVPSLSMLSVYVGLDCPAGELGIPDENLFVNHGADLDASFERVLRNDWDNTDFCVNNGAAMQSSVAPPGCGIVTFMEPTPPGVWMSLGDEDYRARKDEVLARLLAKYEQRFPRLGAHRVVTEFLTPRSFAAITNNHAGAVYGFAQSREQANHRRLKNRTPVVGLFLAGAWTGTGGGYEGVMASGIQTAKMVLDERGISSRVAPPQLQERVEVAVTTRLAEAIDERSALVPLDTSVDLDAHYPYLFTTKVYGDELNSRGNADASSYLRYLDRARTEVIEEICAGETDWLKEYQVKVYRIVARCATITRLADTVTVRTGLRRISDHRAAFDQRIINLKTGHVVTDAVVEVLFVDNEDRLIYVPSALVSTSDRGPDFKWDQIEPVPFKDEDRFPFRTRFRVYFEDTDLQAIMFHVSYVRYCERAMFDIVQSIWPDVSTNVWMSRTNATVARIDIRYLNAARLGDRVEVRTTLVNMDARRLCFGQRIVNVETEQVLADAITDIEFRDGQGNSFPIPPQIVDIASAHLLEMERQG